MCATIRLKVTLKEFLGSNGKSRFQSWFNKLDVTAAAKITTALYRLTHGNFSNVKSVGSGVFENRIHFGPGYRIYFGQDKDELVILLGGGSKKTQQADIALAKKDWKAYKSASKKEVRHGINETF